ncbi:MAG: ABC transporter substrate-binding protein [Alphaproteobacteria bacterium]|nr:ABC transporter substrate-binding protein [Alphaproteobacteria bacterium]
MARTSRLAWIGLLVGGCGIVAPEECTSDEQCVDAFGWGHRCGDAGACEVLEPTASCGSTWPEGVFDDRDAWRRALPVGSVVDSALFPIERDAMRLAVDQVNDLGGVDGRPIVLLECDPAGTTGEERDAAVAEAASFLASGAGTPAVLGPVQSTDAEAFATAGEDVVVVSPGASAISLGTLEGSPVWRTVPSDADLSQSIVRDMLDEGLAKAVIVHAEDTAPTDLANQLLVELEGASFTGELLSWSSDTERDARVVEAAYANADAVIVLSENPSDYVDVLLAAEAIEEYAGLTLYLGPAAYRQQLLTEAAAAAPLFPNVRGVRSATRKGAVADVFRASFASAYGGVDPESASFAGQAYDSAWTAFSAMMWAGMRDGALTTAGVNAGLGNLSFGTPVQLGPAGWDALEDAFGKASPVDLDGASSPLDFAPDSRAIRGPIAVWVIEDGVFVTAHEYTF